MDQLHKIAENLQALQAKASRLSWAQYTTGDDFGVDDAELAVQRALEDKDSYRVIEGLVGKLDDGVDKRRVEIMENRFRPYHLSPELNELKTKINQKTNVLSDLLNKFRSQIDGRLVTSAEIQQILSSEPDRDIRHKAFLAGTQINNPLFDAGFIDLLQMRKEYAAMAGAEDFVALSLREQELDPTMFDGWTEQVCEVAPVIAAKRQTFASEYLDQDSLKPWDERYLAGKIAPEENREVDMSNFLEPVSALFSKFGFDISSYNITFDIFPRSNKSEWGYNFPIEWARDSRILANVRNHFHEFNVLLHETGHGVHSFNVDANATILNMGISGIISEGIANLFGSLQHSPEFYAPFFPGQEEQAARNFAKLKEWRELNALRATHRILFDQALYRENVETIDDIHELWWQLGRDLFGEEPYADEPIWGMIIHYTTHPIYLHNYLLGDLTFGMLQGVFEERAQVTDIMEDAAGFGDFLRQEVMYPAGRYPYLELYKRISGEAFSLRYLTQSLTGDI
jgi:oligoendopeptidase F